MSNLLERAIDCDDGTDHHGQNDAGEIVYQFPSN